MSIDATAVIRQESERLVSVLTATDPGQKVPTCPDWTADDLLWHVAEVHEFWTAILAAGATTEDEVMAIEEAKQPRPDGREAVLERRTAATAALIAQLESHADEDPAWFWYSAVQGVGATRRMQIHESTIHRVDAELTAGVPVSAIDAEVAAAGLDHVLQVMWPAAYEWIPEWASLTPIAVVEIRPEGGDARWLGISRWTGTRPRDGQEFDVPVGRLIEDAAEAEQLPRSSATGSALALGLWAWGREQALEKLATGAEEVSLEGDPTALAALRALLSEGHD